MNRAIISLSTRQARCRLLAALALGLALAGCGRRGELEAPPGSTPPLVKERSIADETKPKTIDAVTPQTRSNVVPPRQPFILDKIL